MTNREAGYIWGTPEQPTNGTQRCRNLSCSRCRLDTQNFTGGMIVRGQDEPICVARWLASDVNMPLDMYEPWPIPAAEPDPNPL